MSYPNPNSNPNPHPILGHNFIDRTLFHIVIYKILSGRTL